MRTVEERTVAHGVYRFGSSRLTTEWGLPPRGLLRNAWRPATAGYLLEALRAGGGSVAPVGSVETFEDGASLDVPASPEVLHLPGHTSGHYALHLPGRSVLFAGDAVATLDLLSGAATLCPVPTDEDAARARESLARLDELGEVTLLPGHGEPWHGEADEAVRAVREAGA